ncbi:hypothetical protein CDL15_Pgr027638 [Punica granatum]|uniref:NB-ARC domain-containing protein n=1 Tax=Punica granatum TaxID=22663 RepID=A0A218XK54_PUNGR|nr:hypothetical protein CDL15_Pgr027638 [Punica granatum]
MVEAAAAALAVETYWDGRNLISYATKKLGYADDLEKNYRRLTEEADKLFARRADVEAQVRKDMTKRITKEYNSIKKLQQVILGRLKLNVEWNNDQSEFAWRISKELENKRKKWDGTGVEPIARLVVNECADLPLLIDRVARNFRKKDSINLRDGLWSLRRWPNIRVQGMEEVLEFLKFCYDDLDDETQKICFLYSTLYPEEQIKRSEVGAVVEAEPLDLGCNLQAARDAGQLWQVMKLHLPQLGQVVRGFAVSRSFAAN